MRALDWGGRFSVRHPVLAVLAMAALAVAAGWTIASRGSFDSDILNMLPGSVPAVRGLQAYNRGFSQNREVAFLLAWDEPPADAARYHAEFCGMLRSEPWVERVLEGSPMGGGAEALEPPAAAALALNQLEPGELREMLRPEALDRRLAELAERVAAGSPSAAAELSANPLGVLGPAAARVAALMDVENSFDLEAPGGRAFVVPVVTTQSDLSEAACREMMKNIRDFTDRARERLGEGGPRIGVTGRSAYVDEVASSMRRDLAVTSGASALAVLAIFWVGFRSVLPLVGIGLLLALAAALATAAGFLAFGALNVVAVSFCSILFGLGDDFSLLLCQAFYRARADGLGREDAAGRACRETMPGIWAVAATTAFGFGALWLSGSAGFSQLGILVGLGVAFCALLMPLFLFLFLRGPACARSAGVGPFAGVVRWWGGNSPVALAGGACILLVALLVALIPWRSVGFDLSPNSLEPRDTPASRTLSEMMRQFPEMFEPVVIVVPDPDPRMLARLDAALESAVAAGLVSRFSSPSPLALDPERIARTALTAEEAARASEAFSAAARRAGISAGVVASASRVLAALADPESASAGWWSVLPPNSPWWFLIDRMFSADGSAALAYLKVPAGLSDASRRELAALVGARVPEAIVTGWSQTLASLVPWARGELAAFGGAVVAVVLCFLALVYRDARAWLVHALAMAGAAAGVFATLKAMDMRINLLNALAFPLMLGVGVDYGTHILLAARQGSAALAGTLKAVTLSAATTSAGFGALMLARNPALSGLGALCTLGVLWSLLAALLVIGPWAARTCAEGSRHGTHPPGSIPR